MGVFGRSIQALKNAIDLLMKDDTLYAVVTYKKWESQSFDRSLGHSVTVFDDTSVDAIKLRHNARSAMIASSEVQAGDPVFFMRYDDAPSGMSLKDEIVDANDNLFNVKDIADAFGIAYLITVESGGEQ